MVHGCKTDSTINNNSTTGRTARQLSSQIDCPQGDENIHLVDNGLVGASRIPAMNGQGDWESQISHLVHAPSHGEM